MSLEVLSLILSTVFGSTGIITLFIAKRERKANVSLIEASANLEMQKGYSQFVIDTNNIITELRAEIKQVKVELEMYQKQCRDCLNNKL
jgi:hypothetical protein